MLGSVDMAARIDQLHYHGAYEPDIMRLGAGAFRVAYLAPDGVVYKVGSSVDNIEEQRNAEEALAKGVPGIPEVMSYTVPSGRIVNAMPFVPTMGNALSSENYARGERMVRCWRNAGFRDLHPKNWGMTPDGKFWLTDLQFADQITAASVEGEMLDQFAFTSEVMSLLQARPRFKAGLMLTHMIASTIPTSFWLTGEQLMLWRIWGGNAVNS